jgi:hypothetical protein
MRVTQHVEMTIRTRSIDICAVNLHRYLGHVYPKVAMISEETALGNYRR